uniref:Uncharacterized protein n=1 Tax=Aplanochytrium stocchinoi TaxID=215587 RepID=A0A7S3LQ46_9STRA|mmetsp:Transcript_11357/g.12879  ORF Transcript_11357/g.12879 Transcript_11357/m.12879 type:complete len:103 (+) Transcript_11357:155-463(+)
MSALKREEPWKGHSDLQEIYPRVFLTNAFGARNLRKLEEKNITHILVAGLFLDKPFLNSKRIEIIYEQLDLCDNATVRLHKLKYIHVAYYKYFSIFFRKGIA